MAKSAETITVIESTVGLLFDNIPPEEGSFTSPILTRRVGVGSGRVAVFQEFPRNRNGRPSGEQVVSMINSTELPPRVISLSMGSHLGMLVCESTNPEVATDLSARKSETWHGIASSRGEALLTLFSQSFVSGLYTM